MMFSKRLVNFAGFAACAGLLGYAYYVQFIDGLEPCPLCIFQRVAFITMGVIFLLAALHNPGRTAGRVYALLLAVAGLAGTAIAGRHVWLQHLPSEQVPECGPGLEYMLDVFPLTDALRMVFTGSGECANVDWVFLGLSMPAWALLCFLALAAVGVIRNWLPDR
jgi:disulfide bond formation protein DsbB